MISLLTRIFSRSRTLLGGALLLVGLAATTARGDVVLGNAPFGTPVSFFALTSVDWVALGLSTSTSAANFVSMDVEVSNTISGTDLTLEGGIYSEAAGEPGTQLVAFNVINLPDGTPFGTQTLTTVTPFVLQPSTNYWLVVTDAPLGILWAGTSFPGVTPTASPGYGFLGVQGTSNAGADWNPAPPIPNFAINATAVPEPGTYALLGGLAACGLVVVRRLRRRAN